MITQLRNPDFYLILTIDLLLFLLAHAGAYVIRFDLMLAGTEWTHLWSLLPLIIVIKLLCFITTGVYRGMWRYVSINDLFTILKATTVSSLILVTMILGIYRFEGFSRGMFMLDWLLTFVLVGGSRILIRQGFNSEFFKNSRNKEYIYKTKQIEKNVIIIGAGDAGEKILREIRDNRALDYRVVGFVDDDVKKIGKSIHGVKVMGRFDDLPEIAEKKKIVEALIAIPSASGAQKLRVVDICKSCGLHFKTLPGMSEIIDGRVSIKSLRDVCYEDLLGRPQVTLQGEAIRGYLAQKVVLVTGAGGSIGSELCRRIINYKPALMVLVDASDSNLYEIQMDMKHHVRYLDYVTVLANVNDRNVMEWTMKTYKPDVIFHAAAYKHVPMLERNPWQAVQNNILGAQTMMELSVKYLVERFILVSTDKAVRPTNVMGASKRICERLMYSFMGNTTRLMAVRFGNVVGSAGSVIPLFRKQIEAGGPVTITHPEVTRFFMTIPEASQLILQAGALGTGGEVFILEMGTPVKIADMARDLIRLSGKEPDRDIEIRFDKLRPGEKLYEELITEGEGIVVTSHKKIMVLKPNGCFESYGDQNGYKFWLDERLSELYAAAETCDACLIKEKLKAIVPEYDMQDTECVF
ncbi:MAG: polysaccharide biosynthesis protein [Desulfamplus sp.]|nr:polysaccharide biosynthesis protein [Desulfamplus sp.]